MTSEISDALCLNEQLIVSFADLAELSGFSKPELLDLIDNGALVTNSPPGTPWTFSGHYVVSVRRLCRLRDDFELDSNALSLSFLMLERIRALESELCELRAKAPGFFRGG